MSTAVLLETAAPVATSVDALLHELRAQGVRLPRPAEVRGYIHQFPDIIPVVRHACDLAVAEFVDKAALSLEIYIDSEIDDRYLTLYVAVLSPEVPVWQAIESIVEQYAEMLAETSGWLVLMPEFGAGAAA